MEKTIKLKEEVYKKLNKYAGSLRIKERRPVSMNYAIAKALSEVKLAKPKLSDFAGSWKMTDAEAKKLKKEIRDVWKRWEI